MISVLGLGYVGSVVAAGLAAGGHNVLGIDIDETKVASYSRGQVPFYEPGLSDLVKSGLDRGLLRFKLPSEVEEKLGPVIFIATGTPATSTGAADLSQVRSALKWVSAKQPEGGIVVMKSTVPPGTGVQILSTELIGSSFDYVSNPEFLREGEAVGDWFNPDRIIFGGQNAKAIQIVQDLYQDISAPHVVTDITSAEMIKYTANAFLATKISFINEIAELCRRMGATIDDVTRGISLDPRIGSSFLRAGVGYGGSCFPKDVGALDYFAVRNGHNFELLSSVIRVNNRQRLLPFDALKRDFGQLSGLSVAVLGLAFKPNTDDIREAPAIHLVNVLVDEGASVRAYDPKAIPMARKVVPASVQLEEDLNACVEGCQALVLMTEWNEIIEADWAAIARRMREPRFLFDGRNALDQTEMLSQGFLYHGVGRREPARTSPPEEAVELLGKPL